MPGPGHCRALAPALAAAAACAVLAPAPARADDLTLVTRELGDWGDALEALRSDLHSEGRRIHVGVRSGGDPVPCDRYRLELDRAASAAFRVGGCDPGTRETLLVLEHRSGLFDDGYHVPRPRTLSLTAVLRATAVGGGGPRGGSLVHCSWVVRPYLDDVEHGTRVMLTPEHYALRSASASVSPAADRSGWNLSASGSAVFDLEYEVSDLASGDIVLRQKTTLTCGEAAPPPPPREPRLATYAHLDPGVVQALLGDVKINGFKVEMPPLRPDPSVCKWGSGKKGCYGSPLGLAVMFTALGSSATLAASAAFTRGFQSTAPDAGLAIPGVLATVGAVVWTGASAVFWYQLAHPAGEAKVRPTVSVSGQGGTLGLVGSF